MDVIIGHYKVRLETSQLVLTHATGISFMLTREEVMGLIDFIEVYRETLLLDLAETEPRMEIVDPKKATHLSEPSDFPHTEA